MGSKEGSDKIAAGRLGITLEEYRSNIAAGLKWCTKCDQWQPRDGFGNDSSRSDGKDSRCFDCRRKKVYSPNYRKPPDHTGRKRGADTRAKCSAWQYGPRNNNWKGGITPPEQKLRGSGETGQWRKAVKDRDRRTCQRCGSTKDLHAHHIHGWNERPDLRLVLANGITLCHDCHISLHRLLRSQEPLAEDWPLALRQTESPRAET